LTLPALAFGTDGWRGVIADDATFETFRRLARAAASAYREGLFGAGDRGTAVLGYDPRFLSEEFAGAVAEVFAEAGIAVASTDRPIPTPAVSWELRRRGTSGGLAVTASHNPARYNGFKLKAAFGGSAPPELYAEVERRVDRPFRAAKTRASVASVDIETGYRRALGALVDLEAIRRAGFRVLADAMHGAAGNALERIVGAGATRIESFRAERDVNFGGGHPEPIAANLAAAAERVRRGKFDIGVATDGDADRLGVLDAEGRFVSAHRILALLILHAFRERGASGGIAKTFSTSLLIDRIGASLGAPVHETGIGFKYVADLMISGEVAVGGEESGGYGFAFHLPERDGTLAALLLLENLARTGRTLGAALADLDREFGRFEYGRRDLYRPVERIRRFLAHVAASPPCAVAGERVTGCREKDGVKLLFGGRGWLLMRLSGTEPMIRLYCEHEDGRLCDAILTRAQERLSRFS
jgi:phosphomannomutase